MPKCIEYKCTEYYKFQKWTRFLNHNTIQTSPKVPCRKGFNQCEKCCDVNGDCRCDQKCSPSVKVDGKCSYVNGGKNTIC